MFKKINRYKVLFGIWAFILSWCVFFSTDVYINLIAIFGGLGVLIMAFCHIEKNMNESEKRFFNNYLKVI